MQLIILPLAERGVKDKQKQEGVDTIIIMKVTELSEEEVREIEKDIMVC